MLSLQERFDSPLNPRLSRAVDVNGTIFPYKNRGLVEAGKAVQVSDDVVTLSPTNDMD